MTHIDANALTARLDRRAAEDIAAARVGGVGVYVMQSGEVLYKKFHGVADHRTGREIDDRTMFRLASMSKPVTAVATLIQVGRGLIDLDEPVEKYLPAFGEFDIGELDADGNIVVTGKAKTKLTPRLLLSHTNGVGSMPVGDKQFGLMTANDMQDIAHVVNYIGKSVLAFEPGQAQMYSPVWAFDVLARLIELTSGLDYATFLQKNLFDPCGMVDTTFAPTEEQWSRMVEMHARVEENGTARSTSVAKVPGCVFESIPTTWFSGGAGLASTMHDYIRFADMLRCGGVTEDGVRILPEALVHEMGTPQVAEHIMPGGERWGLGVRVITPLHPWMPAACFGWSGAYGTHFWVDPENDLIAVLMRNSAYDGGAGAVMACNFEKDVYGYGEQA